jgi:hypothetical protein
MATVDTATRRCLMKLIIAYIKPERLNAVKQELYARRVY